MTSFDRATAPVTEVVAEWWTNPATTYPRVPGYPGMIVALIQGIRALVRRSRRGPAGSYLVVHRPASPGGRPELVLDVDAEDLPSAAGSSPATVLGEYGPNGACCVLLGGRVITPIYPPRTPWGDLARRAGRV